MSRTIRRRLVGERGAGLIGAIAGVTVVLAFLLFATQVLVHLHATTTITSVAHDAVRRAAAAESLGSDGRPTRQALSAAERRADELLGAAVGRDAMTWAINGEYLELRIRSRTIRILPTTGPFAALVGLDRVDRTVRARLEVLR